LQIEAIVAPLKELYLALVQADDEVEDLGDLLASLEDSWS